MADTNAFFTEILPAKLSENTGLAAEINAVYQFDIDGAGSWTVDLAAEGGAVSEGAHDDPGCTFTITKDDFESLLDNPANGMMLFVQGRLQVAGNQALALSLQKIL